MFPLIWCWNVYGVLLICEKNIYCNYFEIYVRRILCIRCGPGWKMSKLLWVWMSSSPDIQHFQPSLAIHRLKFVCFHFRREFSSEADFWQLGWSPTEDSVSLLWVLAPFDDLFDPNTFLPSIVLLYNHIILLYLQFHGFQGLFLCLSYFYAKSVFCASIFTLKPWMGLLCLLFNLSWCVFKFSYWFFFKSTLFKALKVFILHFFFLNGFRVLKEIL